MNLRAPKREVAVDDRLDLPAYPFQTRTVGDHMIKDLITISADAPIEESTAHIREIFDLLAPHAGAVPATVRCRDVVQKTSTGEADEPDRHCALRGKAAPTRPRSFFRSAFGSGVEPGDLPAT